MKRILIALFAATLGFSMLVGDAQARRLGGGSSIGMNRSSPAMRQAAPAPKAPTQSAAPAPTTAQPPAPQPSGMSRWLGPIAGIAAGIGLAALFSHFGLGEGMANVMMILLLVMAVVFVVRLFLNRRQPAGNMQYAGAAPQRFEPVATPAGSGAPSAAPFAPNIPAGFDTEGFLRQAKLNFIRLQAANDSGDMADLKQFTAPEVFAEVQMQYEERGRTKQQTDVVQLNADLLEVVDEDKRHLASVRFHGQLRETPNAAPEEFSEIWHLVKPIDGSGGWLVAGIQQVQ